MKLIAQKQLWDLYLELVDAYSILCIIQLLSPSEDAD